MEPTEDLDAWLAQTLADRRFSRGERQALSEVLGDAVDRGEVRRKAFEIARGMFSDPEQLALLEWLEEVVKATRDESEKPSTAARRAASAHFSPGEDCLQAVRRLLAGARRSLDICVFTITDDRVAEEIVEAHRRGVSIRIITDNEKAEDLGSDVDRIAEAGILVRVDRSPFHMHHKFAVADASLLLTGSYNWTRGAARDNQENLVVTDDRDLIASYRDAFERLWEALA